MVTRIMSQRPKWKLRMSTGRMYVKLPVTKGSTLKEIRAAIREVPDFPKPGILFKDITPVLQDPHLFARVIDLLAERYNNQRIDKIVAIESRGFIFGAPLSKVLGAGLIPLRKQGKLPYDTISESYDLEYGSATLELHKDAIEPGDKVLLVDDLLATGGTARASANLVRTLGGDVIEAAFLVELKFLEGRSRLDGVPVYSMVEFD
jgi:adenine phosphoribosyltransferase